ncbi:hypothetical protein KL918_001115 [Ogataea parapolymorpha]|uniref:Transcriptional regulatory protein ASH1 n=1 Tax=Ogataea parapolymorpha (strain ATCC 26012 / BCRC 20466 / JCM 22074 / NRRL Y-7560 / DL-1) TaxID=871575 RepID=W1QCP6_OGAPD|nr:Transcriptional regulatory protein ASH1 [Ogataea parapolymorpha DL-1]ESW97502.1 Transcriptional regulatory protein ASH1 [Ogataea parapolymorpha DL-1]KAG7869570.1 hypothetical protein KL918_001115 [Ogataea parapolymorpha]KAG7875377.1 hypothetical protein KL916_000048 [Ogataea parapolymorpha]
MSTLAAELNHSRSHSDSTNTKSSAYYQMSRPRSEECTLIHDSQLKRSFAEMSDSFTLVSDSTSSPSAKRSRTAPSSPVPETPKLNFADLPLTPPSNSVVLASLSISTPISASQHTLAQSPATPPASASSSPRQLPLPLKPSTKLRSFESESCFYFPDTCYSFNLLGSAAPESNVRGCLLEQQNEEWRDFYSNKCKHENTELFKKYREYCTSMRLKPSKPVSKVSKPPRSRKPAKIAAFVESQYQKYNGLVDYPYSNNYTYQTTGYLKDVQMLTSSAKLYAQGPKQSYVAESTDNFKLPPMPSSMLMSTQHDHRDYARVGISKFINTSLDTPASPQTHLRTTANVPDEAAHAPAAAQYTGGSRKCISCHSAQSPCWRPSWSSSEGQLCNSCGLRYKKTRARCLNSHCLRIPAKGEWTLMKNKGKVLVNDHYAYRCLHCDGEVEVDE